MQPKKVVHLALNFERNYLIPFYVFVTSVLENNSRYAIVFHVITSGLTDQDKADLTHYITQAGHDIRYYAPTEGFATNFTSHGFGRTTFYRLLFAALLPPEIQKFLYIDVDIVVLGDLGLLYDTDTQGFPVAAVAEPAMQSRPELGLGPHNQYFNAGVLLIDREAWVAQRVSERAIDFLNNNHQIAFYADQDALNATLIDNWWQLESRFNLMRDYVPRELRKKDVESFLKDKVIVHFTQFYKPWHSLCNNKLRFLYYRYLRKVPLRPSSRFIDFKASPKLLLAMLKIRVRELYFDYPLVPVAVVDALKKS